MDRVPVSYFRFLARYNRWANQILYDHVGQLDEAEYKKDRGAFFKSIHGTLNHILLTDRIWMSRIEPDLEEIPSTALDTELYSGFEALHAARQAQDAALLALLCRYDDADMERCGDYTNSSGTRFRTPVQTMLAHMINHGTHHRGQVHDLLSQTPVAPPPLDLIFFERLDSQ